MLLWHQPEVYELRRKLTIRAYCVPWSLHGHGRLDKPLLRVCLRHANHPVRSSNYIKGTVTERRALVLQFPPTTLRDTTFMLETRPTRPSTL